MTTALALAATCAAVVIWHARPWVKPPALTVTLTVDASEFVLPMRRAVAAVSDLAASFSDMDRAVARVNEVMALTAPDIEDLFARAAMEVPFTPDPNPFPQMRLWRLFGRKERK